MFLVIFQGTVSVFQPAVFILLLQMVSYFLVVVNAQFGRGERKLRSLLVDSRPGKLMSSYLVKAYQWHFEDKI